MKIVVFYIIGIVIALIVAYGGWKLDRWVNWKFDYGKKVTAVTQRMDALEKRIEALESK